MPAGELTIASSPAPPSIMSFKDLMNGQVPIAIATHQREFVWDNSHVRQLVADIGKHFETAVVPYFMGTLLLHQSEDGKRWVIDGQQRITALSLLWPHVEGNLPPNCDELRYSPKSARRIREVARTVREDSLLADGSWSAERFDRIIFTVVTVTSVDDAFQFFDTQNTRGKPLDATDLLKAYHLRAIPSDLPVVDEVDLRSWCARRWEDLHERPQLWWYEPRFISTLFATFLYRGRRWRRGDAPSESRRQLLAEFRDSAVSSPRSVRGMPLYATPRNVRNHELQIDEAGREIGSSVVALSMGEPADRPFAIRQPIHAGVGFFLYAETYGHLLARLLRDPKPSAPIRFVRELDEDVVRFSSPYLREAFLVGLLMYLDRFGDDQIAPFAVWFEHALGSVRLAKGRVQYETARNALSNDGLLDALATTYRPEDVIVHVRSSEVANTYRNFANDMYGRTRYIEAAEAFFKKRLPVRKVWKIQEKPDWVRELVNHGQPLGNWEPT